MQPIICTDDLDALYGESGDVIGVLAKLKLQFINELGRADFRFTDYASIERWWEIVFSSYLKSEPSS